MDILPNFLCYETGPVEVVSSPTETMASYRWNVDPRNQLSPKDFTVLKGEKERVNNQVPRSTLEKGLHSTGVNTKRGTGVHDHRLRLERARPHARTRFRVSQPLLISVNCSEV